MALRLRRNRIDVNPMLSMAATGTGYTPNLLAGRLKSKRSATVAALVPYMAVPQFPPNVQTLTTELDHAGYQLILGLLAKGVTTDRLRKVGIPVVETWDLTERPLDMPVGISHAHVGSAVAVEPMVS